MLKNSMIDSEALRPYLSIGLPFTKINMKLYSNTKRSIISKKFTIILSIIMAVPHEINRILVNFYVKSEACGNCATKKA